MRGEVVAHGVETRWNGRQSARKTFHPTFRLNPFGDKRVTKPSPKTRTAPLLRRVAVHSLRVALLGAIFVMVRLQSLQTEANAPPPALGETPLASVQQIFPQATALGGPRKDVGGVNVLNQNKVIGYVVQTSPQSDEIIGFSGPSNLLVGFDLNDKIAGVVVLSSEDTREHVAQVVNDGSFLQSFGGGTWEEPLPEAKQVDGVSGATLTSLAMAQAVLARLQRDRPAAALSLRFPEPVSAPEARVFFPQAATIEPPAAGSSLWRVLNENGEALGQILRTSPAADQIIGFQGPTVALVGIDPEGAVIGLAIGKSFDNEEYVGYVKDETYFLELFNGKTLNELAELDLTEEQVEGVSGATMTSLAVAEGLVAAAREQSQWSPPKPVQPKPAGYVFQWRDALAAGVVVLALVIGFTSLRSNRWVRIGYPFFLIVAPGLLSGDMLSQAMIAGWAENGVPWRNAGGLVLLTVAAMLIPIVTKRNLYCTHICPHGAVQQLWRNRIPTKVKLSAGVTWWLKKLPAVLLAACFVIVVAGLPISLVGFEPFDAWHFRIAGWATVAVAVVGLIASLFVPMAYCRFGCPTGAMLQWLRFSAQADRWGSGDWLVLLLAAIAGVVWLW